MNSPLPVSESTEKAKRQHRAIVGSGSESSIPTYRPRKEFGQVI